MPTMLREPTKILSRLSCLQRSAVVPTLGEIVQNLKDDVRYLQSVAQQKEVTEQYDEAFGSRQDYALWRREFGKNNPTRTSQSFQPTGELVVQGLTSHEPVVVWGVLSMAHGLATSSRGDSLFDVSGGAKVA